MEDDEGGVVVATLADGPPHGAPLLSGECEVVLRLRAYDADLGMRTRGALRRQLDVDLPRSVVLVRGRRARTAGEVCAAASHPRLCTQAVLAPPVEWLVRAGVVAHEPEEGRRPMVVEADGAITRVRKRLGLRSAEGGEALGVMDVGVHADAAHDAVVVTFQGPFITPPPPKVPESAHTALSLRSQVRLIHIGVQKHEFPPEMY